MGQSAWCRQCWLIGSRWIDRDQQPGSRQKVMMRKQRSSEYRKVVKRHFPNHPLPRRSHWAISWQHPRCRSVSPATWVEDWPAHYFWQGIRSRFGSLSIPRPPRRSSRPNRFLAPFFRLSASCTPWFPSHLPLPCGACTVRGRALSENRFWNQEVLPFIYFRIIHLISKSSPSPWQVHPTNLPHAPSWPWPRPGFQPQFPSAATQPTAWRYPGS